MPVNKIFKSLLQERRNSIYYSIDIFTADAASLRIFVKLFKTRKAVVVSALSINGVNAEL